MAIRVGETLYQFDENNRVYDRERGGGPIYSEHFSGYLITGETPRSWLISVGRGEFKVNKKTLRSAGKNGFGGYQWFTKEGMEDNIWVNGHRLDLGNKVLRCHDASKLRKIRDILDGKDEC